VKLAKRAGMKYVVITSKHHDGFCLYDAKNSDWDVMSTPFKRDILKELAVACKSEGMRLCFYHSIMDWHEPDYLPRRPWDKRPADPASFPAYIEYMKAQLKQLVKEYGPLGIMWFDGEWESTWTHDMGKELYSYVRSLQPNIIVNNRVDKGRQGMQGLNKEGDFAGDYGTPEQEVPATGLPGVDWESCITMNDTWGYKKSDTNWKSAPDLIRMLVDVASKGGNLLLNVGPTAEGLIPEASVERLEAMGAWMRKNAESIHGTTASPIGRPDWGRATTKGSKVYLHVFNWPADGRIAVKGLPAFIKRASLLADHGTTLKVLRTGGDVTLVGPTTAPDAVDTVVVLDTQ
jgi:alpha-L-fucosidase